MDQFRLTRQPRVSHPPLICLELEVSGSSSLFNGIIQFAMAITHKPGTHWPSPAKAVHKKDARNAAAGILVSPSGKLYSKRKAFRNNGVPNTTGLRYAKSKDSRRLTNSEIHKETRGRKPVLTERDIRYTEEILFKAGYDTRVLT